MKIAVIGGGAAGFFAAISCKNYNKNVEVVLFEKTKKLLAKVKVSGGGRCNVTNSCFSISELAGKYPRGEKFLKKAFSQFYTKDTIKWFESRQVKLKVEADNRMFPVTDDSQTIIDCLLTESRKLGVEIRKESTVEKVIQDGGYFILDVDYEKVAVDKIIVTTGGSPKMSSYLWLQELGHKIEPPIPSLFTFNMPNEPIKSLMGLVADNVTVSIQGTKLKNQGALLITHWGMSGPAILKLSAFAARELYTRNYDFEVRINWLGSFNENQLREKLHLEFDGFRKRKMINKNPFNLPSRLWLFLLEKVDISQEQVWDILPKKKLNQLINVLLNDLYKVKGKTTFKEEFVTCGGVSLQNIDVKTMESKVCPGLYFSGEVMDIDGVTGGFNFQAAWTTGFIAGKSAVEVLE
ncbi:NAD(P)/FAD-dependent oxidoreductase [Reichenbachiella sp. MALMAid0571]|uniref:NAD(P)/FAD-dependent oxidoreductase n=1 Tax=Reichenbachiella sp. MALMAid0571 TaxID=3143939 RepID=UPI0032E0036E